MKRPKILTAIILIYNSALCTFSDMCVVREVLQLTTHVFMYVLIRWWLKNGMDLSNSKSETTAIL